MRYLPNTPKNIITLLARAHALAGFTIENLAYNAGLLVPDNLKNNKGWIGKLIELYLGANSKNKAQQDFINLGIELKTIPIDSFGHPIQNTFICTASINNIAVNWEDSNIYNKLSNILWIPIEGTVSIPLKIRKIGKPLLWSPNIKEKIMLRKDWEEIIDMIVFGKMRYVTTYQGTLLQIKTKNNNKMLIKNIDSKIRNILSTTRSFYLKRSFTKIIMSSHHII
ncbi:DNA mismatch repair endonuclease MutH [Candidatus Pantoea edessiphila]|uniref:DNA mismatch repair protein MutH n=1 Tax=Candidatus Pantoea edessiphila TaxID=2044610 RepID=A0A2P5SZK9_9GAMM|nr:DNA mismatch repair endonuclease MutH [Candidatus Pantoea edessiphila]PPI87774.1 DNA mismatch repair endonuclease MutH [Candidatus Pantoea edessiphila]